MDAIATINAEIAKLEARIAGLRYAHELLGGAPCTVEVYAEPNPCPPTATVTEPPAKKPTPPATTGPEATKPTTGPAGHHAEKREKRRSVIARHLSKGPMSFGDLERTTGVQPVTLRMDLDCPYFEKTNPNHRLSRWTLTESGRKLAESAAPG